MAVPAFFMLSGFVLAYNYTNRLRTLELPQTVRFLLLRLVRVYPVHLATLLAVAVMVRVGHHAGFELKESGYSASDFVLNLFLVHTWVPHFSLNWNYPSWSISSEWFAYILFPFAVAWGIRRVTTIMRSAVFGLTALVASIAVMFLGKRLLFYELILVIPTFAAGMSISCAVTNKSKYMFCGPWLIDLLAISIPLVCVIPSLTINTALLLCLFFSLIATLACAQNSCHFFWTARPAVFLGEVSYSLYMTHTLALRISDRLLPSARFAISSHFIKVGLLATDMGIVITLCLGCYYLIEKPCRDGLRHMLRERASRPIEQVAL
jgi:peptidoglycan/LPS O-acetylase OafA/YrhL